MPIRLRITLWTAGVLLLSLLGLSTGVYYTMARNLRADVDTRLRSVYTSYSQDPGQIIYDPQTDRFGLKPLPDPFASTGVYIQIASMTGATRTGTDNLGGATITTPPEVVTKNEAGQAVYYDTEINGQPVRVYSRALTIPAPPQGFKVLVQVAERLTPLDSTLERLRTVLLIGSLTATLALSAAAWLVAGASLKPLARMSAAAASIGSGGDLSTRIEPPHTHDEVQQLAVTFNEMLERLESNFGAQRRFVADASHELRTPLTALRANADIMLRQLESGMAERADLLEGLSDMRSEVDRMTRLVHNLLILARADVGWRPELTPVELTAVAGDVARIAAPLRRGQTFELEIDTPKTDDSESELYVKGNADQLMQLMLILLDNAFTHTPAGTHVTLRIAREGNDALITVSDSGPGIPAAHLSRIFERFYRADEARTRTSGGTGLGLSIARWIVAVHGASLDALSDDGQGATFRIRLPALPPDQLALPREPQKLALTPG